MDTEAEQTERDRSPRPSTAGQTPDGKGPEGRSRSALLSRLRPTGSPTRFTGPRTGLTGPPTGLTDWLPGGRITLTLLVCLVSVLLLNTFVAQPFQIPSGSMEPGLRIGDRVLVDKLAYGFGARPQRGDVIVFDGTGYFGHADYVKRVVGVEGDHVVCCDKEGRIEVNGRPVDETAFLHPGDSPSEVDFDVVVPGGTVFVLGDHRSDSADSRDHLGSPGGGMIPVSAVIGRAEWIVWPPGRATRLERPGAYARVPDADGAHG